MDIFIAPCTYPVMIIPIFIPIFQWAQSIAHAAASVPCRESCAGSGREALIIEDIQVMDG